MSKTGMFITLEGGEAVGKTTNANRLVTFLAASGSPVVYLREPGTRPGEKAVEEAIRGILKDPDYRDMTSLTEFFLFQAARAQFVKTRLRPALEAGTTVVLDRYALSTMAYQIAGRGLPMGPCLAAIELATGGLVPDITFLLTCSYERSRARQHTEGRTADRLEQEPAEFHRKVLQAYEDFARLLPTWNVYTIRTDMLPPEDVFQEIVTMLRSEEGIIS